MTVVGMKSPWAALEVMVGVKNDLWAGAAFHRVELVVGESAGRETLEGRGSLENN